MNSGTPLGSPDHGRRRILKTCGELLILFKIKMELLKQKVKELIVNQDHILKAVKYLHETIKNRKIAPSCASY